MSSVSTPIPSGPVDPTPSQPPAETPGSVEPSVSNPTPSQSETQPPSGSQPEPSASPSASSTDSPSSQPTDTPSTSPPNPSPSTGPSHTISAVVTTDANGGVVTVTRVLSLTHSAPSASNSASSGGSTSFFDNKGAVAGTFTVVGLLALGLLFVVVTWGIRRRRAKQFDRDVAEAAREAAHASPPTFLDDPDDGDRSYATQNYVYSDNSHGTYAQPPMDHYPQEAYNMSEINRNYPSAGAAGVGVMRARSQRTTDDAVSAGVAGYGAGGGLHAGFGENQSPYPVFSAPGAHQPHDAMYDNRYPTMHDHGYGDTTATAATAGATTAAAAAAANRQPSQTLARQKSQGGRSLVDGYYGGGSNDPPVPPPESYASRYQPGYKPDPSQFPLPPPPADIPQVSAATRSSVYRDDEDPYGGYSSQGHQQGDHHPNNRHSVLDDSDDESEDKHDTRRVLKVANE